MCSFPGLPHRMEEIGRRGPALFVNDSKATNADSTEKALTSFDRILWILGGKAKEGGIDALRPYFPKVEKAYLIGAATEDFARVLEGEVPYVRAGTLDKAVELAAADAAFQPGFGAGRAPVAGLRVLRPVSELRGARKPLPRSRPGPARHRTFEGGLIMVSRAERSAVGDWWWTVDRSLLAALAALMVAGLVFLMAGGPPVAERLGLSTFHFVNRQVLFLLPTVAILLCVSFLSLRHVRRLALIVYALGMGLVFLAFQFGPEIKGAHRWIMLGPVGIQPSEFVKPAFVVLAAWAFSEGSRRSDMPGTFLAFLILPATIVPLILQPDFGQTMLVTIVWCGLFFVAGLHWFWVMGLGGAGLVGIVAAYEFLPHVRDRIERFMDK